MNDHDAFLDRMKVRETAEVYFFFSDAPDPAGVAQCFARNGIFRSVTQTEMFLQGRAAIEEGFRGFTKWGRSCHALTSMHIELDGGTARTKLFATSTVAGAAKAGDPVFVRGLTYADQWILEDGRWVIAERVHEALWQFQSTLIHTKLPGTEQD